MSELVPVGRDFMGEPERCWWRSRGQLRSQTSVGNSDYALVHEDTDFAIRHAEQGLVDIVVVFSQRGT